MKQLIAIITTLLLFGGLHAQVTDFDEWKAQQQQAWNQYKENTQKIWAAFRDSINAAYAEKMQQRWEKFQLQAAKPVPAKPEPPKPVAKPVEEAPAPATPLPTPVAMKPKVPEKPLSPQPILPAQPIERPAQEPAPQYTFSFHHTPCAVHLQQSQSFSLPNASESSSAAAWKKMSESGFDLVADDCLKHRERLTLDDWGYIELTKTLSESFLGKGTNESVLMQIYLLAQSGYRIRIARNNNRLIPLIPFTCDLYGYSYLTIDGEHYYLICNEKNGGSYSVFNEKFDGEKTASLFMRSEPNLTDTPTTPKTFTSKRYPAVAAEVAVNKNLIEYYNNYPVTDYWNEYAKASLSRDVKKTLYPILKREIAGKSEVEAANILLNFVQTAFPYKTDQEQFGYERPLFGDEIFYYPFCDCEDRSILFCILVHDLLKLNIVMLEYPNHIATAVRFKKEVSGYYIQIEYDKFVICDPTYIGASVGDCMPQFRDTKSAIVVVYE